MAGSVVAAAQAVGLSDVGIDLLSRAHALAMTPRLTSLEDDHHPAYLHPGRSVLVLLRDVGVLPTKMLCAAAVHESVDEQLRVSTEITRAQLGDAVAVVVDSFPLPGDERLAERLVMLEESARLAALAERLDQLRHAHLRDDIDWRPHHAETGAVWLPVAERTHARLADRYRHWQRTFARRLG